MPTVIPVKFRYASRDLWFDPRDTDAIEGDHVICETERGLEIGLATEDPRDVSYSEYKRVCGDAPLRPVVRLATDEDLELAEELAEAGDKAMPVFRRYAEQEGLDMKPVGVEYLFDGDKVVCYFSADDRVDFRQLVRSLSRELHRRIDMRQIGVREEAALVGGFGHCGQELCCARFGRQFEPVSIRMAKEQDLPLNSAKISGACGRLMCCLRYEFEAYRDFKQRAPKRNAVIETPLGKAKIVEYDTPKEELALRLENGKLVRVKLAEMKTSEAARKKSEELKCPCRPDTVTREALEKLNSPDVQMALAELDRANGLVPEETFDDSDLFVSPKPRRRSRSRDEGRKGQGDAAPNAGAAAGAGDEAAPGRKRRRRKGGQGQGQGGQGSQGSQGSQGGQQGSGSAGKGSKPQQAQASGEPTQGTRRRRRHHSAAADAASQGAQTSSSSASQQNKPKGAHLAQQGAEKGSGSEAQAPRRRRRPGDKGNPAPAQQRPQHLQQTNGNGDAASAASTGAQPKKRRRRRHRKSGGSDAGANAPSTE
jgi:cell fate regulator YaaT (PSP1 superfamily)